MFRESRPSNPEQPSSKAYKDLSSTFIGSFPLSPQQISGHYLVFDLAAHYYRHHQPEIIAAAAKNPPAPHLDIPKWHIPLPSPQGTAESIWGTFMSKLANPTPDAPEPPLESLFAFLARTDQTFYDAHIKRHAPQHHMSHLRRYFVHGELPAQNKFYDWLKTYGSEYLSQHKSKLLSLAVHPDTAAPRWQQDISTYIKFWDQHFIDEFFTR